MNPADDDPALLKRWVETWKFAGPELERIKREELRAMTEAEALEAAQRLSSYSAEDIWIEPGRSDSDGLIEQQRLFLKGAARPQ